MASARYRLNLEPEPPEEPPVKMTGKKKLENFWFYYKWHILAIVIAVVLIGSFVYEMATKVEPDYQIALLSDAMLPDAVLEGLSAQLAAFADDFNDDGRVEVSVTQYTLAVDGGDAANPSDPYTQMAGVTKLMADAQGGDSMLFLTNNVAGYQQAHGLFAYNDDTAPAQETTPVLANMGVRWMDCPQLATLDLGNAVQMDGTSIDGQEYLQDFVLVKRVFFGTAAGEKKKLLPYYEASLRLFATLTARA